MANADCIVIQGSNMAECHPVGFQWVEEAKSRGAKIIHVDPRFTRTSAIADKHVFIRAGSDVVLLGALINYVLANDLWFKEYVVAYTNAATLINEDFRDTEELGGLFSGYEPETGHYDPSTWAYAENDGTDFKDSCEHGASASPRAAGDEYGDGGPPLPHARVLRDETLQDPRTVFQILRRHYARYTPEMVREVCGISADDFGYLARDDHRELRPGAHDLLRLRPRLDAALPGRAVHQDRRDPAVAARQHGAPGRRHHGPARARQHPGVDRHPDVVQPPSRVPADAERGPPRHARRLPERWPGRRSRRGSSPTPTTTW